MAKVKSPEGKELVVLEEGVDALAALGWEILERDEPAEVETLTEDPEDETSEEEPKKPTRARKAPEPKK